MSNINIKTVLFCSFFLALETGCAAANGAKTVTTPAAAPVPAAVQYSLPKTMLMVELLVERANEFPGKYCDFLDLFFPELELVASCQSGEGANPGVQLISKKTSTAIQGYGVTLKGIPDTSRTHDVNFDASWHVERTDSMSFTEGGTLTGAEIQRADRTGEIIFGILSNVAQIAGRFVFGAGKNVVVKAASEIPWERIPAVAENFSLLSKKRQEGYETLWGKTEGKARLVLATRSYQTLMNDLGKLDGVMGGTGAVGAQTLVAELRKQIGERFSDDFLGSKTKQTWNPVYELTPAAPVQKQPALEYSLFKFSGCGVSEESRQPVRNALSLLRCAKLNGAQAYELKFTLKTASGEVPARIAMPDTAATSKDALYHIRPEAVSLNLVGDCRAGSTLLPPAAGATDPTSSGESHTACNFVEQPSLLAQWGVQATLPKAGKDWAYTVSLYEATGALKSVKLSSKAALDKGTIDSAFGIANTLLDAKAAADKEAQTKADAAASKVDQLNVLIRSRQILDEKNKIKGLCKDLGLTECEY